VNRNCTCYTCCRAIRPSDVIGNGMRSRARDRTSPRPHVPTWGPMRHGLSSCGVHQQQLWQGRRGAGVAAPVGRVRSTAESLDSSAAEDGVWREGASPCNMLDPFGGAVPRQLAHGSGTHCQKRLEAAGLLSHSMRWEQRRNGAHDGMHNALFMPGLACHGEKRRRSGAAL
jgi:hypothetical protein